MTLICGIPNAGKTTFSAQYGSVIHFDRIPHKNVNEQFKRCNELAAQSNGDVCVEGVYNRRKRRLELLEAVKDKQGKRICIWLDTPIEICLKRENRGRPSFIISDNAKIFEPPTLDEGWDEIIIVR